MSFFFTQLMVSFITILLRGLQTQNIINKEYKSAAVTSILMSVSGVVFIGMVASDPWSSLIPVSLGSMVGVLCSMYFKK